MFPPNSLRGLDKMKRFASDFFLVSAVMGQTAISVTASRDRQTVLDTEFGNLHEKEKRTTLPSRSSEKIPIKDNKCLLGKIPQQNYVGSKNTHLKKITVQLHYKKSQCSSFSERMICPLES